MQLVAPPLAMKPRRQSLRNDAALINAFPLLSFGALILLTGMLISAYTFFVNRITVHGSNDECLRQASLLVANELSKVSVTDERFGRIGLYDWPAGTIDGVTQPVTSLNRLYAGLVTDAIVAQRLNLPYVRQLILDDLACARRAESRLFHEMEHVANQPTNNGKPSLFQRATRIASNGYDPSERFSNLKMTLGQIEAADATSLIQSPNDLADPTLVYGSCYRAGIKLPVFDDSVTLYPCANETSRTQPDLFRPVFGDSTAPSAVLLQATFQPINTTSKTPTTHTACAVLGGNSVTPAASVLLLSFPHGMPLTIGSLRDLLQLNDSQGFWKQAVDGSVPGSGRLSDPQAAVPPTMGPNLAAQTAFYHWLKSIGPAIDTRGIVSLTTANLSKAASEYFENRAPDGKTSAPDATFSLCNSAVAKETGARAYALQALSSPSGKGQTMLASAFAANNNMVLPKSAVPLIIDQNGACHMPGKTGFDEVLVKELLDAIYSTNLASIESGAVASDVSSRMDQATEMSDKKITMMSEQLQSLNRRMVTMQEQHADPRRLARLRTEQAKLSANYTNELKQREEYAATKQRALAAEANAKTAAVASFNLASQLSKYATNGIFRVDRTGAFLLGRDIVFLPKTAVLTDSDLYTASADSEKDGWSSKTFNVLRSPTPDTTADGNHIQQLFAHQKQAKPAQPAFVVFDSQQSIYGNGARPAIIDRSPFGDTGVTPGQCLYYCAAALHTGSQPAVGWSLLIRDLVANAAISHTPIVSSNPHWCGRNEGAIGSCPGLAVEMQFRSPVPILPQVSVGGTVFNPITKERAQELPPIPPSML